MVQEKRGVIPYLSYVAVSAALNVPRILPYKMRLNTIGWLAAHVIGPIAGYDKRIRNNLTLVCPELDQAQVDQITTRVLKNAGRFLAEMWSGPEFYKRLETTGLSGPGIRALQEAKEAGRPILLLSGHLGNYDAGRAVLIQKGYKMGGLYRPMSNAYFNKSYKARMEGFAGKAFEQTRRGMAQMVKHLRAGGMLAVLPDQREGNGTKLSFFGHPAMTTLAMAEMAIKYDALLIPAFSLRKENGLDFEVIIENPIEHSTPEKMMQEFNDCFEALVRQNMDQFFWVHNRWKMPATEPSSDKG